MNDVLPPEQSGFREKHSITTRFVQFLQHISSGLLQQTATLVIYVDFIKAFDQLWHDGLICKRHKMNCPYELVIFIVEYLKNRKSYNEMNRLVSSIFDVERGFLKDLVLDRLSFFSSTANCLNEFPQLPTIICTLMILLSSSMPLRGGVDLSLHRRCNVWVKKH